ncbi:uncharacterized protein VDAG_09999 [Verticillium dahliae VdLs.17]|uniref:Uncharacterized protein n=1 Tax=Verticillium dahliae (strain VdLs.17 / ATCC MYA-4575 / FGSC 10137) TaxID=498257 RepID=G2XIL7_VERDV|nr:uncharacterized protein VDAG_09999 [Verticillium dahliae VdLs.17]EGY20370.1 hypothetical protein VDAG_09999 [Verticillium dahliae VdLs.17]KAH6708009.1 hypothetical protein EV126DRAFT_102174 [Verticillium dahliae]
MTCPRGTRWLIHGSVRRLGKTASTTPFITYIKGQWMSCANDVVQSGAKQVIRQLIKSVNRTIIKSGTAHVRSKLGVRGGLRGQWLPREEAGTALRCPYLTSSMFVRLTSTHGARFGPRSLPRFVRAKDAHHPRHREGRPYVSSSPPSTSCKSCRFDAISRDAWNSEGQQG